MNPHEFASKYGRTLHIDPETNETYLKVPVTDLKELACMQEALLQALQSFSQLKNPHKAEPNYSIYWISKILMASYPGSELEGLAEFLERKNVEHGSHTF